MTKIEAIEKTIFNLENDVYGEYNWWRCNQCNCGILARTIMNGKNVLDAGLFDITKYGKGFAGVIKLGWETCSATGRPLPEIFQALKDTGFTFDELNDLEDATGDKEELIVYLKAWVEVLKQIPEPSRPDITKELAVFPIDETSDLINQEKKIPVQ